MLNKLVGYYSNYLLPFLGNSVFCGYIVGVSLKSDGPIEQVQHMVSYTTYGKLYNIWYCVWFIVSDILSWVCSLYIIQKFKIY